MFMMLVMCFVLPLAGTFIFAFFAYALVAWVPCLLCYFFFSYHDYL